MEESCAEASLAVMTLGGSLSGLKPLYDPNEERPDLHRSRLNAISFQKITNAGFQALPVAQHDACIVHLDGDAVARVHDGMAAHCDLAFAGAFKCLSLNYKSVRNAVCRVAADEGCQLAIRGARHIPVWFHPRVVHVRPAQRSLRVLCIGCHQRWVNRIRRQTPALGLCNAQRKVLYRVPSLE